jgi:hypothetical protein
LLNEQIKEKRETGVLVVDDDYQGQQLEAGNWAQRRRRRTTQRRRRQRRLLAAVEGRKEPWRYQQYRRYHLPSEEGLRLQRSPHRCYLSC